jgi:hypothetical protein
MRFNNYLSCSLWRNYWKGLGKPNRFIMALKFYALCTRNIYALMRHAKYIPKDDLFIIINSQNEEFIAAAEHICKSESIDYAITESDGTAATGKNSFLDTFLASENDYAVLVDGDDFITPHGVVTYRLIANMPKPPDAVGITNQIAICRVGVRKIDGELKRFGKPSTRLVVDPDSVQGAKFYPFRIDEGLIEIINATDVKEVKALYSDWVDMCKDYISPDESHIRVTFISKKCAEQVRYNKQFTVGEDTLYYLDVKKAALENKLTLMHHKEYAPTYVYDQRVNGVVQSENKRNRTKGGTLVWLYRLVHEFIRREQLGLMPEGDVPRIRVEYPDGYRPDNSMIPR